MRFIALMTPTIQKSVNGRLAQPRCSRVPEGVREDVDAITRASTAARHGELHHELPPGARAAQVVVEAEQRDGDAAHEEADDVLALGEEHARRRPLWKSSSADERRVERQHDGDAAQARDGAAVDLAGRERVVERADAVREPPHERRQDRPVTHREDEGDRRGSHGVARAGSPQAAPGGRVRTQFPSASTSIRVLR